MGIYTEREIEVLKVSTPKEGLLSERGKSIWESLDLGEKLYCKYCFLQNTAISGVIVGVVSAYFVNILTNVMGITFEGPVHIVAYIINAILSIVMLICVVQLYSIHVDCKEKSDATQGMKSHHTTLELVFFKENRSKIRKNLGCLLVCISLLLATVLICVVINNLDSNISPTSPSDVSSCGTNFEIY